MNSRQRFGDKKWEEMRAKAEKSQRETIRKERLRIKWGLPQKTRLKLYGGGSQRANARYWFRKLGYYVPRASNVVYYDKDTDRRPLRERRAVAYGLRVEELPKAQKWKLPIQT